MIWNVELKRSVGNRRVIMGIVNDTNRNQAEVVANALWGRDEKGTPQALVLRASDADLARLERQGRTIQ